MGAGPGSFDPGGFVEAARRRGIPADLVAVDLHASHYFNGTFLERLRTDIVLPARAAGYTAVWLVGTSMGGLGALYHHMRHPGEVSGVVAFAPFLGEGELLDELRAAGGAHAWRGGPPAEPRGNEDYLRELWVWLRGHSGRPGDPPIFLGYGREDRFAEADRYLAQLLPAERVRTAEGGHAWAVWLGTWERFLDEIPLVRAHGPHSATPP